MELKDFAKRKDYLVCVDSDGCAMDTMDIKHFKCFVAKSEIRKAKLYIYFAEFVWYN